ncbi:MAG: hypothetical protein EBS29_01900 [Chloroflexia bacterium]|nr:hypothetical protein [Chloroflexia bacterium]
MQSRRQIPLWLVGVAIGVGLIAVSLLDQRTAALRQVFRAAPTPRLPDLIGKTLEKPMAVVSAWLADGASVAPATTVVHGPRIALYVEELRRVGSTLEIRGRLVNQSTDQLHVAVQDFTFVDAAGIRYGVDGPISIVEPAGIEPFAFTVPVPPSRVLTMTVMLAPDPPLVLPLLQESTQP